MKAVIYIPDDNTSNTVAEHISKLNESMKIVIVDNAGDCIQQSSDANLAFIGFNEDEVPVEELISRLANNGINTYYIAEDITEELFDRIIKAGGKKVIALTNIEQDLRLIMRAAMKAAGNTGYQIEREEKRLDIRSMNANAEETSQPKIQRISGGMKNNYGVDSLKAKKYPGIVITIHGAKGGIGKTTTTVNLGVALASQNLKTVAVDLDVENGNLASVLHLNGEFTIKDWVKGNIHEEDDAVITHESGLKVIPGIKVSAEANLITAEATERILSRLARRYDVVIVDTGAIEINPMLTAMMMADKCYVLADYDITRIPNLINLLNDAKSLNIDLDKMKLVMNNVPDIKVSEKQHILENIPIALLTEIKKDNSVLLSVNNGYTPYLDRRCKNLRAGIDKILDDVISNTEISKKISNGGTGRKLGGFFKWL